MPQGRAQGTVYKCLLVGLKCGIYTMHIGQACRYFPLPDYDLSESSYEWIYGERSKLSSIKGEPHEKT
jgi:hypothetical protein